MGRLSKERRTSGFPSGKDDRITLRLTGDIGNICIGLNRHNELWANPAANTV